MIPNVNQLWKAIGEFDAHELKVWYSDDARWEARESARMQAYNVLFDQFLDKEKNERRFHCFIVNQSFTWEEFLEHKKVCDH